jgi:hypothetical protein
MKATVGDKRVQSLVLHVHQHGPWFCDAVLDEAPDGAMAGAIVVKIESSEWHGTVAPAYSGTFSAVRKLRVVGGANGWASSLPARQYHNDLGVKVETVIRDAAAECGETIGNLDLPSTRLGHDWTRARRFLERVFSGRPLALGRRRDQVLFVRSWCRQRFHNAVMSPFEDRSRKVGIDEVPRERRGRIELSERRPANPFRLFYRHDLRSSQRFQEGCSAFVGTGQDRADLGHVIGASNVLYYLDVVEVLRHRKRVDSVLADALDPALLDAGGALDLAVQAQLPSYAATPLTAVGSDSLIAVTSEGWAHFPHLAGSGQNLQLAYSVSGDLLLYTTTLRQSTDGGTTWGAAENLPHSSGCTITLSNGDTLWLPYTMWPDGSNQVEHGSLVHAGVISESGHVTVTGFPRAFGTLGEGTAGFVFSGHTEIAGDGQYLATMYGLFSGDSKTAVLLVASPDGYNWTVRSIVADSDADVPGTEGPGESTTLRLADGQLAVLFRTQGVTTFLRLYTRKSSDDGATWGELLYGDPASVMPGTLMLGNGVSVMATGRTAWGHGLNVWWDPEGQLGWRVPFDLEAYDDTEQNAIVYTTGYIGVAAIDSDTVIVAYDAGASHTLEGWQIRTARVTIS